MTFPLPIVEYTDNNNFNKEVFTALRDYQVFALSNLPTELSHSVVKMFDDYDHFLDSDKEYKSQYEGTPRKQQGLYIDGKVVMGAEGYRYFVCCDEHGYAAQKLPGDDTHHNWRKNCEIIQKFSLNISKKIANAIDIGLTNHGLPSINKYFEKLNIASSWHRYIPTQNNNQTSELASEEIITFSTHQDLVAMAVLFYRDNQTRGLQGEFGKKDVYLDINMPESNNNMIALVVTGLLMEHITDKELRALPHRVKSKTFEEYIGRRALVNFINLDYSTELPKSKTEKNPFTVGDYFNKIFTDNMAYLKAINDDLKPGKMR